MKSYFERGVIPEATVIRVSKTLNSNKLENNNFTTNWLYDDIMWRVFSDTNPDYIEVDRGGKYGTLYWRFPFAWFLVSFLSASSSLVHASYNM